MRVSACALVIRQIPTRMIRIVVNHDRIGTPVPIAHIIQFEWSHREIPIVEPEPGGSAARQTPDMTRSKTACKPAMLKGPIHVKTRIVPALIVSDPGSAVDMRGWGMSGVCLGVLLWPELPLRRRLTPHRRRTLPWRRRRGIMRAAAPFTAPSFAPASVFLRERDSAHRCRENCKAAEGSPHA